MSEAEHICTYYCQDGLHAYVCLSPLQNTAAEVRAAANTWLAYLGWPDEVVRVQPAREMDVEQVLRPHMIEVDHWGARVQEVNVGGVDVAVYRPWVVVLREADADAGEGAG